MSPMTRTKGRMCSGKRRHPGKDGAEKAKRALIRRGANPARLAVYECGHCGGWHLGHLGRPR